VCAELGKKKEPLEEKFGREISLCKYAILKGKFVLNQPCPLLQDVTVHNRRQHNIPIHFDTAFVWAASLETE
jgi:hypothetical protein